MSLTELRSYPATWLPVVDRVIHAGQKRVQGELDELNEA